MFWTRFKYFLILLKIFAIIFLIIALSRPQTVDVSSQRIINKGIDIIMTIDISSSMLAQDLKPNRLNALKKVASSFIENRVNDRIGLVLYAGESYTKTPITSDKNIVKKSLSEIAYEIKHLFLGLDLGARNGGAHATKTMRFSMCLAGKTRQAARFCRAGRAFLEVGLSKRVF